VTEARNTSDLQSRLRAYMTRSSAVGRLALPMARRVISWRVRPTAVPEMCSPRIAMRVSVLWGPCGRRGLAGRPSPAHRVRHRVLYRPRHRRAGVRRQGGPRGGGPPTSRPPGRGGGGADGGGSRRHLPDQEAGTTALLISLLTLFVGGDRGVRRTPGGPQRRVEGAASSRPAGPDVRPRPPCVLRHGPRVGFLLLVSLVLGTAVEAAGRCAAGRVAGVGHRPPGGQPPGGLRGLGVPVRDDW
jgi:hypothetical protein